MTALKAENIMNFPKKTRYAPENAAGFDSSAVVRETPFARFLAHGVPTPKLERWKYTNLAQAVKSMPVAPVQGTVGIKGDAQYISRQAELAEDLPPQAEKYKDMALWDLNAAYVSEAVVIDVPQGTNVEIPFSLDFQSVEDDFSNFRLIIKLGQGATATLMETHAGTGAYWKNNVIEVVLAEGARLNHIRVLEDSEQAVFTNNIHVVQARDSHYDSFVYTIGAKLSRQQLHADLEGENVQCDVNVVHLTKGTNSADSTFEVAHMAPHCQSNQLVRSVLDGQSKSVFQGKVYVDHIAQKTDGYQLSNALILSEGAEMNTKPELEIYADDVKCSHGATTGQIDEDMMFYLRSRGLSEEEATSILVEAFIGEAVDKLTDEDVKAVVMEKARAVGKSVI